MCLYRSYFVHWARISVWITGRSLFSPAIFLILVGYLIRVQKIHNGASSRHRVCDQNPIKNDQKSNTPFSKHLFDNGIRGMAVSKIYWKTSLALIWLDRQKPSSSGAKFKKESNAQGLHSINRGFICYRGRGLVQ